MSKLFNSSNTKKLVNTSKNAVNAAAIFGIDCMAGTAGGVCGAFVGGVTEGAINSLLPNAPQPVKTIVGIGSTAVGLCSAVATATIVQGKLMKSYQNALEGREALVDIITDQVIDDPDFQE